MMAERWRQIDALLQEALKRAPEDRAMFLDEVCATDEAARKEIESLISFHEQAETFLEVPAFEAVAKTFYVNQPESIVGLRVGAYKIEALLGAGGMGEVYLAEDTKLDRKVAIKFLPADLEADELAKRRLVKEAKAAARLDHPNICSIYEVAEEATRSFIVMQYIEGETLASRLKRKPLELRESLDVAIQVADALAEAHSRGIVHRDIKPHNVMITPRGQVKVLDFGLAKVVRSAGTPENEDLSQSMASTRGVIAGTVPYMSPEQAKGAPVDARSDLASLGVMLYECVAAKAPFSGDTLIEVCAQVIHLNPPPPSQFNPHAPIELDSIIIKALAKNPDERYQSAGELFKALCAVRDYVLAEKQVSSPFKFGESKLRALAMLSGIILRPRVLIAALAVAAIAASLFFLLSAPPHRPSPEALHMYNKGADALREGAYHTASKAFERAIEIDDKFALAHARLAEAYAELDDTEAATYESLRARTLAPDPSKLPDVDALHMQAVTRIVLREFEPAIESYQQIAAKSHGLEKAHAYLDLGRAYEMNGQIDKAKASYKDATEIAPQEAAAFLRLGVLYNQQRNLESAAESLNKAESLYQSLGNEEGVTEAIFQRGILFISLGKLSDARAQLEKALNRAQTLDNRHQQIKVLLELSRLSHKAGDLKIAHQYADQAIELARANRMENLSTNGLIKLGYAFFTGGSFNEAEKYFQRALDFAELRKARRNEAKARLALGSLYIELHDADKGLPYVEQALAIYRERGYLREASAALTQRGFACLMKRDCAAALETFEEQLKLARQIGDQSLMADSLGNMGIAYGEQEQFSKALDHFNESLAIYESLGNQYRVGIQLLGCSDMLWRMGRSADAHDALNRASLIAEQLGNNNEWMLNRIALIGAQIALSEQNFSDARIKGQQAFEANSENEHAAEAMCVLGLAQIHSGAKSKGKRNCEDALAIASKAHYKLLLRRAQLALAEAMLEIGDAREALNNALQAQSSFRNDGQKESEWRASIIAARACLVSGDDTAAHSYAASAAGVLAHLRQEWGEVVYNDYLGRKDNLKLHKHLNEILTGNKRSDNKF